jgi:hypothetical protein
MLDHVPSLLLDAPSFCFGEMDFGFFMASPGRMLCSDKIMPRLA